MPIYEYQCKSCGHEMEALQKLSDAPLSTCPDCGEDALKKKISAVAFRLKGGGWYETDFKTGNKKNVVGEKSSSDGGDSGKSGDSSKGGDKGGDGKAGDKAGKSADGKSSSASSSSSSANAS